MRICMELGGYQLVMHCYSPRSTCHINSVAYNHITSPTYHNTARTAISSGVANILQGV